MFEIWEEFANQLELTNPINYMLRLVGWGVLKLLVLLNDGVEKVLDEIISLNGFFSSPEVTSFITQYKPFVWVLFAISLVIIGYQLIFNRIRDREQLPTNILFAIAVLVLLSTMMVKLNDLSQAAVNSVNPTEKQTVANQVLKENLTDVYLLDQTNFSDKNVKNNIPLKYIDKIDIVEVIDTKKVANEALTKRITQNEFSELDVRDIQNGFFAIWKEGYYRWGWNFWNMFFTLGVTGVTLLITCIKLGRILFELAFQKFFTTIVAAADLSSGQRTKQILMSIFSNFAILFIIAVTLKLYTLFTAWLVNNSSSLTHIILLIAASWALIDGPNIVERVLGVDAGLQSGWKTIASTYMLARGAKNVASVASKAAGAATVGGVGVSAAAAGTIRGLSKQNGSMSSNRGDGESGGSSNGESSSNTDLNQSAPSIHDGTQGDGQTSSGEENSRTSPTNHAKGIHGSNSAQSEHGHSQRIDRVPKNDVNTRSSNASKQDTHSDASIYQAMNEVADADQGGGKNDNQPSPSSSGKNTDTIGSFIGQRFKHNRLVSSARKGYSLGYNTGQQAQERAMKNIELDMKEGQNYRPATKNINPTKSTNNTKHTSSTEIPTTTNERKSEHLDTDVGKNKNTVQPIKKEGESTNVSNSKTDKK